MKLYYASSVCSLAVRIIVHELNLSCEFESVNLKTKKTEKGADYLDVNPKGSVPTLLLNNNEILTENAVINHADKLLSPVTDINRYRTLEWLNFVSTDLHRYCAPLFWSKFSDETKNNVFLPILKKKLSFVDKELQKRKFLMGEQLTLGDSYLFVILIWLAKLKMDVDEWSNLSRYFHDMKSRNAVKQALREEDGINYLISLLGRALPNNRKQGMFHTPARYNLLI